MSLRAADPRSPATRDRRETLGLLVVVTAGALMMMGRVRLLVLSPSERFVLVTVLFGAMLVGCLLVPVTPGTRRLHPAVVVAVGILGLGLAAWASGRPTSSPYGGWAIVLALLAAVAEEALFRRVAFAALEPAGVVVAIGVTSLLFALVHLPLYGVATFPVDLGAGLLFGWQRWASGSWRASAATHAAANLLVILR
jgi:membrane protease YdiL (CAAX protease family)